MVLVGMRVRESAGRLLNLGIQFCPVIKQFFGKPRNNFLKFIFQILFSFAKFLFNFFKWEIRNRIFYWEKKIIFKKWLILEAFPAKATFFLYGTHFRGEGVARTTHPTYKLEHFSKWDPYLAPKRNNEFLVLSDIWESAIIIFEEYWTWSHHQLMWRKPRCLD